MDSLKIRSMDDAIGKIVKCTDGEIRRLKSFDQSLGYYEVPIPNGWMELPGTFLRFCEEAFIGGELMEETDGGEFQPIQATYVLIDVTDEQEPMTLGMFGSLEAVNQAIDSKIEPDTGEPPHNPYADFDEVILEIHEFPFGMILGSGLEPQLVLKREWKLNTATEFDEWDEVKVEVHT